MNTTNENLVAKNQPGIVKWFHVTDGYGFIIHPDYDRDVFVHYREILCEGFKALHESQNVNYDLYQSDEGKLRAKNVAVASVAA